MTMNLHPVAMACAVVCGGLLHASPQAATMRWNWSLPTAMRAGLKLHSLKEQKR